MKAISIRQSWASCIATDHPDAKRVENRGRPTSYRGPVAIHASLAPDTSADHDERVIRLWGRDPRVGMPVGVILAVADLVDCHQVTWPSWDTADHCCLPWGEAQYAQAGGSVPAWHLGLDNVCILDRPVPAKGQLGVPWNLPADVAIQVEAQIGVAS